MLPQQQVKTHILLRSRKTMVNTTGQDDQVALPQPDPHPVVSLAAHIEVTGAVENVPDLLVLVQVLVEEALDLLFVDVAHLFWRDCDLVSVLVVAG